MAEQMEVEASNLGWVPQEQFKGDPEKWVDATTFVERGKAIMPILRKNNEVLQSQVARLGSEVSEMRGIVAAAQESMQAMRELHKGNVQQAIERTRKEVIASLRQAKTDGDIDAELALTEQLQDVNQQLADVKQVKVKTEPVTPAAPVRDEATEAWIASHDWFDKDLKLTGIAMGLANAIRADAPTAHLKGTAFYNKLDELLAEYLPSRRNAPSKVAPAGGSGGGSGGEGGKGYADLPADAKAECEKEASKFVGEGRAFKTKAEWQAHFADLYNQE